MVNYFHYLPSGEIICTGECPEAELKIQVPLPNASIGVGKANYLTHFYNSDTKRVELKPERPSSYHEWDYPLKQWVFFPQAAWDAVRKTRNELLAACDYAMLPDSSFSSEEKKAWASYRSALRDITKQPDPLNISWPVNPSEHFI